MAGRGTGRVRGGLALVGRGIVRVGATLLAWTQRTLSWMAGRWRSSLQFRVVASTVALCLVVMGLLQTFLYQRIADGLVQDRVVTAKEEAAAGTREIQSRIAATDKLDVESLKQNIYTMITQQESQRGENTRDLILMRALKNNVRDITLDTLETGTLPSVVPDDIRRALANDPQYQQVKVITVARGEATVSAVLVGAIVRVPEAGDYELYYVYPMDRQEAILGMVARTFLLGVLIFAVLVGMIAHVVTRFVVDPVREAAVVAERLASGRLNERLDIKGEDDLAKLATSFNDMADTLQAQISRLEDLSAVQQRFVSDVSHELRTPLTTIRMAAEVIFDDRSHFPPVAQRSTEILHGEVERFEELLADLLEISRFDAGGAVLERDNGDIRTVVERVLEGAAELARHKGSTITLIGADEPLRAEMDPRRVERIIRNLVANALEHGEGRPLRIEFGGNDAAIAVAVRDFGIGLQAGESDLVFTRFWRADPARKRTTGGTGLGLAIALEDARLHDGWLQAWGEPGEGSRFRLTLPRVAGRPIGYSPLSLADPAPEDLTEAGVPVGEPIRPAAEPIGAPGDASQPTPGAGPDDVDGDGGDGTANAAASASVVPLGSEKADSGPILVVAPPEDTAPQAPVPAPATPSPAPPQLAESLPPTQPADGAGAPPPYEPVASGDDGEEIDELDRMPTPEELLEIEAMLAVQVAREHEVGPAHVVGADQPPPEDPGR